MGIKNIQGDLHIDGNLQVSGINIKNEDESLETTATTVIGAINQLHQGVGDISTALENIINITNNILGGTE